MLFVEIKFDDDLLGLMEVMMKTYGKMKLKLVWNFPWELVFMFSRLIIISLQFISIL